MCAEILPYACRHVAGFVYMALSLCYDYVATALSTRRWHLGCQSVAMPPETGTTAPVK